MKYIIVLLFSLTLRMAQCQSRLNNSLDGHQERSWSSDMTVPDSGSYKLETTIILNYSLLVERVSQEDLDEVIVKIDSTMALIVPKVTSQYSYMGIYSERRVELEQDLEQALTNPLKELKVDFIFIEVSDAYLPKNIPKEIRK